MSASAEYWLLTTGFSNALIMMPAILDIVGGSWNHDVHTRTLPQQQQQQQQENDLNRTSTSIIGSMWGLSKKNNNNNGSDQVVPVASGPSPMSNRPSDASQVQAEPSTLLKTPHAATVG